VTSALYEAVLTHTRHEGWRRTFRHRVWGWLYDLDRPPPQPRWLEPFARIESRDHLGDPHRPLRVNLDRYLAEHGIDLRGGRVLLLANARSGGYVFNPLSVFWCHDADGSLRCVVAEVHNTYGERHAYLLEPDAAGRCDVDKSFYVSPFIAVAGRYRMSLPEPDGHVALAIALERDGRRVFSASLVGRPLPATPRQLLRLLARHPLMGLEVAARIRLHGLLLWLAGLPVVPRRRGSRAR
jgi:DUF1365 family protein